MILLKRRFLAWVMALILPLQTASAATPLQETVEPLENVIRYTGYVSTGLQIAAAGAYGITNMGHWLKDPDTSLGDIPSEIRKSAKYCSGSLVRRFQASQKEDFFDLEYNDEEWLWHANDIIIVGRWLELGVLFLQAAGIAKLTSSLEAKASALKIAPAVWHQRVRAIRKRSYQALGIGITSRLVSSLLQLVVAPQLLKRCFSFDEEDHYLTPMYITTSLVALCWGIEGVLTWRLMQENLKDCRDLSTLRGTALVSAPSSPFSKAFQQVGLPSFAMVTEQLSKLGAQVRRLFR